MNRPCERCVRLGHDCQDKDTGKRRGRPPKNHNMNIQMVIQSGALSHHPQQPEVNRRGKFPMRTADGGNAAGSVLSNSAIPIQTDNNTSFNPKFVSSVPQSLNMSTMFSTQQPTHQMNCFNSQQTTPAQTMTQQPSLLPSFGEFVNSIHKN